MKRRHLLALTAVAALAAAGWFGWQRLSGSATPAAPATAAVTRGTVERSVLATGVIEAAQLVSVGARVSGQIETLAVDLGDRVQEGELIAQIDDDDQVNAVRQAEAEMLQLRAQINAQKASIRQAELAVERARTLNERALSSTADLETAEAAVAVANADLAAIEAQVSQAEVTQASAQTELDRTRIVAPMTGTVVAVVTKEGTTVNANTSSPTLVKLANLDTMVVKAEISEADVVSVTPGLPSTFTLSGAPDLQFDATLRALEPAPSAIVDSDTISTDTAIYYNALLDVPNPDGILRIGMTAQVTIVLDRAEDVLTVPVAALGARQRGGQRAVTVYDPATGARAERLVRVGLTTTTMAEITEGLEEGEQVVLNAGGAGAGGAGGSRMRPPGMMRGF
ncbi:efflux RND transporter periplasmic adaptor subunit [Frigidibacter oleivorans]|uniref:efflux RND transporter periplasmic adaptor subunit n=1 Tax=Frigidibacter oleivorans TaxID=2487129 RepID=UPI000F8F02BC|nr:efflux RND transporter periplasmic adaptor subunit [Frigidibacter oleivorans]